MTLRALLLYELHTGKSALKIDYSNLDDLYNLCYSLECAKYGIRSRAVWDESIEDEYNSETLLKLMDTVRTESEAQQSFIKSKNDDDEEQREETTIKELVGLLIAKVGLPPTYVLDELPMYMVGVILRGYESKMREQMEWQRMWTYLTMLPHIDGKKHRHPKDILPFAWESNPEMSKGEIERGINEFKEFMKHGETMFNR